MIEVGEMGFKLHVFRDKRREHGQKKEGNVNGLLLPKNMNTAWFCPELG